jgi:hypothetical protein
MRPDDRVLLGNVETVEEVVLEVDVYVDVDVVTATNTFRPLP